MKKSNIEKIDRITEILQRCKEVARYNNNKYIEAGYLAYSFNELTESFQKLTEELYPKLDNKKLDSDQIYDILHDIGEEYRHIIYHIFDNKFFKYLNNRPEY